MTKGSIRNISGAIILIGHLGCIALIILKWRSMSDVISLGAPILPVISYAFVNVIRFSVRNEPSVDDIQPAMFLFSFASLLLTIFVVAGNILVILMVDSEVLGTSMTVSQGREIITWLESALGGGYALIVEGLFQVPGSYRRSTTKRANEKLPQSTSQMDTVGSIDQPPI
jgi:hypothetical protein